MKKIFILTMLFVSSIAMAQKPVDLVNPFIGNEYCKYNGKMADLIETLYKKIKAGETIPAIVEYVEEVSGKAIRV